MILSDLEQRSLTNATNFSLAITAPGSRTVRTAGLSVFLCPSSTGAEGPILLKDAAGATLVADLSPGQYVGSAGQLEVEEFPAHNNGIFYRNSRIGWPVRDCETANVMILGHTGPSPAQRWVDVPNYKGAGADDFWSLHPGGCNFLFADGSVRFLKETIDPRVFSFLATRAGGEVVSSDQF
ncbi:hypothetical protein HK102_009583 [Quaeritorhiza haematococci]|nr:hypothetical protein HK102_009583 [Quaeritorhiza haematococci]